MAKLLQESAQCTRAERSFQALALKTSAITSQGLISQHGVPASNWEILAVPAEQCASCTKFSLQLPEDPEIWKFAQMFLW